MNKTKQKQAIKKQRRNRIRAKIRGNSQRPRLSVFRSNRGFYLQIIDDSRGLTLISAHSRELKNKKNIKGVEQAAVLGSLLADKALAKNITQVVFDRSVYKYHGRIKAIADGARAQGLQF